MMHYIGIDIGGTGTVGGIVTDTGQILAREERPTPIKEGGPRILQVAIDVAQELMRKSTQKIQGIGIGAGGQIDTVNGCVLNATDVIPGWKGMRITETVTKALGLPSAVDNDVNVLGIAETHFGAARDFRQKGTVIFLALGTGVGGAIVIDGRIHYGKNYTAGELGHIILDMGPDARTDLGGAKGTLEAFCSGPGLAETYRKDSGKTDPNITGHDVVRDAEQNPQGHGAMSIRRTGEYLGYGLASLANTLGPDCIIVGGGLSELGDALLAPACAVFNKNVLPGQVGCPIITPQLGVDAPIVGAACLVMIGNPDAVLSR